MFKSRRGSRKSRRGSRRRSRRRTRRRTRSGSRHRRRFGAEPPCDFCKIRKKRVCIYAKLPTSAQEQPVITYFCRECCEIKKGPMTKVHSDTWIEPNIGMLTDLDAPMYDSDYPM